MPKIDHRDDTRSSDVYEVLPEVVDLTVICYDHWVSFPEGTQCPDCMALIAAALKGQS